MQRVIIIATTQKNLNGLNSWLKSVLGTHMSNFVVFFELQL